MSRENALCGVAPDESGLIRATNLLAEAQQLLQAAGEAGKTGHPRDLLAKAAGSIQEAAAAIERAGGCDQARHLSAAAKRIQDRLFTCL